MLKRLKYGEKYNPKNILVLKETVGPIALLGGLKSSKNKCAGVEVMWHGSHRQEDLVLDLLLMKGKVSEEFLPNFSFEFGLIV